MKKKKSKNFIIPLVIYPFDVMVSLKQSDVELVETLNKFGIDTSDNNMWKFEENGIGRCISFPTGQLLIRLAHHPKSNEDFGTLQHEIFHAVHFFMKRMRMKLNMKNDEAYAYLIGYLTQEIYKNI